MARDLVIVGSSAAAIYGWLCAVVPPAAHALRMALVRRTSASWSALALAAGCAVLWTCIAAAALFIGMMLEPHAGLALVGSSGWLPGVVAGAACWLCHAAAARRMPRIGSDFEVASVLALVALLNDDPFTLSRVEDLYRQNAAPDDPARSAYRTLVAGS
jgi:hypothetical protein